MADHEHFTPVQIIAALKGSKGFMSQAARSLGCTVTTICKYRDKYPEIKQAIDEEMEERIDKTETKLLQAIDEGNITAIIFFLKTMGKKRGYIERQELDLKGYIKIEDLLNAFDDEDKNEIIHVLGRIVADGLPPTTGGEP